MRLHVKLLLTAFTLAVKVGVLANAQTPVYRDAAAPIERRVEDLVRRLTLEEKITQMTNSSAAIPRLDIPAYDWWNEGLHGVARSGYATMFPKRSEWQRRGISRCLARLAE